MTDYPKDWQPSILKSCGKWYSGGTPSKDVADYWGGEIPWISAKSMYYVYVTESDEKVTELGAINGTRLVPENTILILVRGSILFKRIPICLTERTVTFNQDVKAIMPKKDIDPQFLLYWLLAHEHILLSKVEVTGMGAGKISTDILENFPVHLPSLAEQRAIATILGTWDEAIALTEALIIALQQRKQGLMQKMLTGDVRFSEFDDEWVKKPLHYLTKKRVGLKRGPFGGALKKAFFVSNGYKVYQQKNAIYQDLTLGDYYIDDEKFSELNAFEVLPEDFIVSCSGTIGKIARIPSNAEKGVINQALLRIRLDSEKVDLDFFQFQFESEPMQRLIIDNTHGGAMQNLVPMTIFRTTPFMMPSIKEQKQIAEVLKKSDQLISGLFEYVEYLQQQKKGLTRQLLTGQVRVKVES